MLARPAPSLVDDTPNDSVIDPATAKLSWSAVANAANTFDRRFRFKGNH